MLFYPDNLEVKAALYAAMKRAFLPDDRVIKSLVMVSGGLDSVALLASLLAHTTHEIHAHHVEIRNAEGRAEVENATLERVLPYLRERYRPFAYSTSKYELMMGQGGGTDMTLAMFMAARVTVAEGTFTDLVWTGHLASPMVDYLEASAVFTACFTYHRYKPVWVFPFINCKKTDIYASIPPELADMTWSCRTPVLESGVYRRCGKCHACQTRDEIARDIAQA